MTRTVPASFALAGLLAGFACAPASRPDAPGPRATPVPWTRVTVDDAFWSPRQRVNQEVTIPYLYRKFEETDPVGEGLFKTLEASAYAVAKRPDAALSGRVRAAFAKVAAEWLPREEARSWPLERWGRRLYELGHYIEAAVAWHAATGDREVLASAVRVADLLDAVFGLGRATPPPNHEEIEIGLVRLFEATGETRYRALAGVFVEARGRGGRRLAETWSRDHEPVVEQDEAVGHCVAGGYLYTAVAALAATAGNAAYEAAIDRIWADVVERKTHLIGGLGAVRLHERFGAPYELPNVSCWCETCAAIANVFWNERMFRLKGDAKYVDVLERSLYNNVLAGVSRSGDRFFYQNVLKSFGRYPRFEWINVPCCPPNLARLVAGLGGYVYATGPRDLYVNLFVSGSAEATVGGGAVSVAQESRYPWDGAVKITVTPERARRFTLRVRIPGWARNRPLPGGLYSYAGPEGPRAALAVNGRPVEVAEEKGYAVLDRRWTAGDVVELRLPMPVRRVLARPEVTEDDGFAAFERGPLVFCAEGEDNGGHALDVCVPDDALPASEFRPDLLSGVAVITVEAATVSRTADGALGRSPHRLTLVPYGSWNNRSLGEMAVWLARRDDKTRPRPIRPPSPVRSVSQSGGIVLTPTGYGDQNDDLSAVFDGFEPLSSADESQTYYRLRPAPGRAAWIEYAFERPTRVSSAKAWFVDDRRFCALPRSWRVLARVGGAWREVAALGPYSVEKDRYSEIAFEPVVASAVRLEVTPRTVHYEAGKAGPPAAMPIDADVDWRECGVIELRVR